MNQLFTLVLVILLTIFGFDIAMYHAQAWNRGWTRQVVLWTGRQLRVFTRWAWRNYWREVIWFSLGSVTTLMFLLQYFQNRFP